MWGVLWPGYKTSHIADLDFVRWWAWSLQLSRFPADGFSAFRYMGWGLGMEKDFRQVYESDSSIIRMPPRHLLDETGKKMNWGKLIVKKLIVMSLCGSFQPHFLITLMNRGINSAHQLTEAWHSWLWDQIRYSLNYSITN